jgi:dynein heavy chain, axonemal
LNEINRNPPPLRQIKEVTSSQEGGGVGEGEGEAKAAGPLDEIEFWSARNVDLGRLHDQLQSKDIQRILQVLEASKSSYMKNFRLVEDEIQKNLIEARENLKFLSVLKEPCQKLINLSPKDLLESDGAFVDELLRIVRLVWEVSTHYNTQDRISALLRSISNLNSVITETIRN